MSNGQSDDQDVPADKLEETRVMKPGMKTQRDPGLVWTETSRQSPAYDGASFGAAGASEWIFGCFDGEVDDGQTPASRCLTTATAFCAGPKPAIPATMNFI